MKNLTLSTGRNGGTVGLDFRVRESWFGVHFRSMLVGSSKFTAHIISSPGCRGFHIQIGRWFLNTYLFAPWFRASREYLRLREFAARRAVETRS